MIFRKILEDIERARVPNNDPPPRCPQCGDHGIIYTQRSGPFGDWYEFAESCECQAEALKRRYLEAHPQPRKPAHELRGYQEIVQWALKGGKGRLKGSRDACLWAARLRVEATSKRVERACFPIWVAEGKDLLGSGKYSAWLLAAIDSTAPLVLHWPSSVSLSEWDRQTLSTIWVESGRDILMVAQYGWPQDRRER